MDEKRVLLAIVLSIVIMVGWYAIFPPPKPVPPTQPVEVEQPTGQDDASTTPGDRPETLAPEDAAPVPTDESEETEPAYAEARAAASEERFTIENQHFSAEFSNAGARLLSFRLLGFTNEGDPLELLLPFPVDDQAYLAVDIDDRELAKAINTSLFETRRETVTGGPEGGGGQKISFEYSDGAGLEVRKSVTIWNDEWIWDAELEVIDRGRRLPARLVLGPGFAAQEERGSRTYYYGSQILWYDRTGVQRSAEHCGFLFFTTACRDWKSAIRKDGVPDQSVVTGRIGWAGLEDQFFTALAVSRTDETEMRWVTRELALTADGDDEEPPEPSPTPLVSVSVPSEGAHFYFGPKRYAELKEYGIGLERTVWFSSKAWLAAIVRTMYLGLRWLHGNVLANWGVAIVLATFILRVLLFPLNQFAMVRMRRTQAEMQRIQPKIKAIRNKYAKKKDAQSRQKMNEETMALYRAEGINPMGGVTGCLPIFLQFPILIGFYNMLTVAVELRGAPFILWIKDLSQPDPYLVIPLAMGVTMFVQQKMAMTKVTDPMAQQQQKFMMFMPFMFTFFCLQMPAGMVLYWFVNNLLGIGQQQLVNRQAARSTA
ncbi:MAG: membrane protein insertase YidC [Acidobacteria bacterium]|nr:membrane protein insertase YidC [Acidobacteriota bacterium]NIM63190.1 membrane protein insertase YidC [Acidobacteriota bacterium]NIO58411.1 membrane protein insertase YidC [Acidobacteriota bacterium]NIQ29459.1 membrane protein insertase YidC [Acidobacteriota bacterium]NIQ84111.1 membrane protein insertase YidC [Acidobacteriota bacterium]